VAVSSPSFVAEVNAEKLNLFSLYVWPCYAPTHPAEIILESDMKPGSCWPMKGGAGFVVIRLSESVVVESVSLEHIAFETAQDYRTAPKRFRVWGINQTEVQKLLPSRVESAFLSLVPARFSAAAASPTPIAFQDPLGSSIHGTVLGECTYPLKQSQLYECKLQATSQRYSFVKIEFLENNGGNYTCVYRFRVHGHR